MTKGSDAQAADPYDALTSIVAEVVQANAERNDRESRFPRENLEALAAAGWTGVLIDRKYGGLGLGHQAFAATGLVFVMHVGAAQTINLFGDEEQKERWLKPNGKSLLGTYSTSERA